MSKFLASLAAAGALGLVGLTVPAGAAQQKTDGVAKAQTTQAGEWEFSDRRRSYHRRYYGRRYWGPRYSGGYYAPYYAYAPAPYYRPYYRPAPFPFFPFFW